MFKTCVITAVCVISVLAGCGGGSASHSQPVTFYDAPSIRHFDLTDTLGQSTFNSLYYPFRIDALDNNGAFSLSWRAQFTYDYNARIYISPTPYARQGRLLSTHYCGLGYGCGYTGAAFCNYTALAYAYCNRDPSVDVLDWVKSGPRRLYFVLELCDTRSLSCAESAQEATFY